MDFGDIGYEEDDRIHLRNAQQILIIKPQNVRTLGRLCDWEVNIRLYLRGVGYKGAGWINMA
jgi:hypothetical protein